MVEFYILETHSCQLLFLALMVDCMFLLFQHLVKNLYLDLQHLFYIQLHDQKK